MPADLTPPAVPSGPILVVSPEMGDAALSCAALLARDERVTVLDVFTSVPEPDRLTDWDRRCGFATAKEAMAAREHEEAQSFAGGVHEVLAVDLLAQRYTDDLRGAPDVRRLREAVVGWIARTGGGTIALPAGAGMTAGAPLGLGAGLRALVGGREPRHADPDHLWVRDTVIDVVRGRPDVAIWLYEELPHLRTRPADSAVRLVARWAGCAAQPVALPVDRAGKARRVGGYASQVRAQFGVRSMRRLRRRIPGRERYWALVPAAAA
jgi:hypothetical protein